MPERIFRRDDPGYEAARRATMWNARLPDRFPEVIAQATDVDDVVDAVKLANREELRIAVCSGGHSWSGHHIRGDGVLLDVSRLNEMTIDKQSFRVTCGPGLLQQDLSAALGRRGLFFPTGHCQASALADISFKVDSAGTAGCWDQRA